MKSNDVVQNSTGVVLLQKEFKRPFLNTLRRREIEVNCDIFPLFLLLRNENVKKP